MNSTNFLKTILVTGSNKGIGFGIVKGLLEKNKNYRIILTSRDENMGKESVKNIHEQVQNQEDRLFYHQLDITDANSIAQIISWIKETFGQIDVLVNNAAVAVKGSTFNIDVYNYTFKTNVFATIDLTESFITQDLIRKNGKIVMIGSVAGTIAKLTNENLKNEFRDEEITTEKLISLSHRFEESIKNNKVEQDGWPIGAYSVSKMIINTYPRALARRNEINERNIGVYSCHPGWVKTDMAGAEAPLSIEEGVVTPIFVIELDDGIIPDLQGKYFDQCKVTSFLA